MNIGIVVFVTNAYLHPTSGCEALIDGFCTSFFFLALCMNVLNSELPMVPSSLAETHGHWEVLSKGKDEEIEIHESVLRKSL